ncbi:hypothetical protein [Solibacillus sp. CAU 1738]|uniref:hypothetical protein n=1 Tax=Solibacillus sp. CAU 1738 TaxID=3140363 RepID=UPI0032607EAC
MNQIIKETMESYNEYIKKLIIGCETISEELRNHEQTLLNNIMLLSEGIEWLISVNKKFFELNIGDLIDSNEIKSFLIEINDGLENKDYLLVADIIEYEMKPFFESLSPYEIINRQ